MPYLAYIDRKFSRDTEVVIDHADSICSEYMAQGFTLTLRQLYYQFVARALIANKQTEYKRVGSIVNDARLAGRLDWDAIEDRTRNLEKLSTWDSPRDILKSVAQQFRFDRWATQEVRVEVWIEKEALVGVIEPICEEFHVPFFACRGYSSQSEQWRAGQRFSEYGKAGQSVLVLHLGDHDPSGVDMTRDNESRLGLFCGRTDIEVRRIALNMDQVRRYRPPPNPAKFTDSRCAGYVAQFGTKSWELDALDPKVIAALLREHFNQVIDSDHWGTAIAREKAARRRLDALAKRWKDESD